MITKRLLLSLPALALATVLSAAVQPRAEYPRPQFERSEWQNLNGDWTYALDLVKSGVEAGWAASKGFQDHITVPFCPESRLSGVEHKDFIPAMWYHRTIAMPQAWQGKHVILHFGAVDYRSRVFIDGKAVTEHFGGSSSFEVDITREVADGRQHDLVVYVQDDLRSHQQAAGKQSRQLNSYGCMYTRVTGIWQTVWLEAVAQNGLRRVRVTPDLDNGQFLFEPEFMETEDDVTLTIAISDGRRQVAAKTVRGSNSASVAVAVKGAKTWSPESPFLYDVEYTVRNSRGETIDRVRGYAGMRKTEIRGKQFYLNNQPYFMRLVLDQGYYPEGIWTAPSDEALRHDIEMSKEVGFNGARLHQKVFEQRYLYWADRLGYLAWGESASWGMDWSDPVSARNMLPEWEECVARDYNAPCIVAWSPLNETWLPDRDRQRARLTNDLYFATHRLDRTRPVVATSGGYHAGNTDIFAEHNYSRQPLEFLAKMRLGDDGMPYIRSQASAYNGDPKVENAPYKGEAYIIDEYGGIGWFERKPGEKGVWGYGQNPKTLDEFYTRLDGLTSVLLSQDHILGFCYTQITDVEQEKNGIYTYERKPKFDAARLREIFTKSRAEAKAYVERLVREGEKK